MFAILNNLFKKLKPKFEGQLRSSNILQADILNAGDEPVHDRNLTVFFGVIDP